MKARSFTADGAFAVLRAPQWAHFAVLPLAAVERTSSVAAVAVAVLAGAACLAYAYALNAIADRATDAPDKNPLAGLHEVPDAARGVTAAAAVVAVLAAAPLGRFALALVVVSLVAGTIYSVGPRWKALPVLGVVANTAIFAPLLGLLGHGPRLGPLAAVFVGLLVQSQLLHELADAPEDVRGGVRTTAQALGPRATRGAAVGAGLLSVAAVVALRPPSVVAFAAALGAATTTVVAVSVGAPERARALHRRVALAAGAALLLLGHLP